MIKSFFVSAILLLSMIACRNNHKPEALRVVSVGLIRANGLLRDDNGVLYASLEDKTRDPQTKTLANQWAPRAFAIRERTQYILDHIERLVQALNDPKDGNVRDVNDLMQEQGTALYDSILAYRASIAVVFDTARAEEYDQRLRIQKDIDSLSRRSALRFRILQDSNATQTIGAKDWLRHNLLHASPELITAMLYKLQNDLLTTERELVTYCDDQAQVFPDFHTSWVPVVYMDRSYVKAGEKIEVQAGIASFDSRASPKITINGKLMDTQGNGYVIYDFTANDKPGTYRVPVSIMLTRPDGSLATLNKMITYTVVR